MQPVSLTLAGEFWDCQIYSGELTLFGADNSMHRVDWGSLIDELASENKSIQTALRVAFSDSDLFYTQKVRKILRDPDIEKVIRRQLDDLSSLEVVASQLSWEKYWRTTSSPFSSLPVDTDIYYHHLLAALDNGLFSAPRSASGASNSSRQQVKRHHDGRILQVRASHQSTAVAAAGGDDGLFEFAFRSSSDALLDDPRQLAKRSCGSCDWAFQSIMAWDSVSAFLANFSRQKDPKSHRSVRVFDEVIDESRMFPPGHSVHASYVWGSHEKIFKVSRQGLEVLNYAPLSDVKAGEHGVAPVSKAKSLFKALGSTSLTFGPDDIVATGTAPFGSIVELSDRLLVLRSDGAVSMFPGAPVHWRVYPRSEHYSNQLHLIYEDHAQIVSFVHDYFVEQKSKLTGFAKGSNDYIVASTEAASPSS